MLDNNWPLTPPRLQTHCYVQFPYRKLRNCCIASILQISELVN